MLKNWIRLLLVAQCYIQTVSSDDQNAQVAKGVCDVDDNDIAQDACAMQQAFGGSKMFSTYFPDYSPVGSLSLFYGDLSVGGAQQLSPSRVVSRPNLYLNLLDAGSGIARLELLNPGTYTIFCVDYQPQPVKETLIWLETGVAAGPSGQLIFGRNVVIPYTSPNPSENSGVHEYTFFALKESSGDLLGLLHSGSSLASSVQLKDLAAGTFDFQSFVASNQIQSTLLAACYFKSSYDGKSLERRPSVQSIPPATAPTDRSVELKASPQPTDKPIAKPIENSDLVAEHSQSITATPVKVEAHVATSIQPSALSAAIDTAHENTLLDLCSMDNDVGEDGCNMKMAFSGSSIIPKVLSVFQPSGALYVQYGSVVIGGAQQMSPSRVHRQPQINFQAGDPTYQTYDKTYLLLMVNTAELKSDVSVSWVLNQVTIDQQSGNLVFSPEQQLCQYIPPAPTSPETQNYIFLLFEQSTKDIPDQFKTMFSSINAQSQSQFILPLTEFISASGLSSPVAGSFFKSQATHSILRRSKRFHRR